ncbi:MAG: hypothetical protein FWF27_00995 [Candidatus Bathyarchaeota archaeon]|nr:hypothetical protein [Candidatus Termiticorpusculum sp.]
MTRPKGSKNKKTVEAYTTKYKEEHPELTDIEQEQNEDSSLEQEQNLDVESNGFDDPVISAFESSQSSKTDDKNKEDSEEKKTKSKTKKTGKKTEKIDFSKVITSKNISAIFKLENKFLHKLGPDIELDEETIELLGEAGEEPVRLIVEKYLNSEWGPLFIFGGIVLAAHLPVIMKIASRDQNKQQQNNNAQYKQNKQQKANMPTQGMNPTQQDIINIPVNFHPVDNNGEPNKNESA